MSRSILVTPRSNGKQLRSARTVRPLSVCSSTSSSSGRSSITSLSSISLEFDQEPVSRPRSNTASVIYAENLSDAWPRRAAFAVAELVNTEWRFIQDLDDIISVSYTSKKEPYLNIICFCEHTSRTVVDCVLRINFMTKLFRGGGVGGRSEVLFLFVLYFETASHISRDYNYYCHAMNKCNSDIFEAHG